MNNLPQNLPLISDKSIFSTKFSTIDLEVRNSNLDFFFFGYVKKKVICHFIILKPKQHVFYHSSSIFSQI